ncbi:MAG: RNA polymerase sigma factor [Solirubrobacteraceae bacterium]
MGPQTRFEQLYRAHAGRVRAYALRRTTGAAADDVVADVFLVAWRRLDDVPEDVLPWLLGVARRVLANRRRGDSRAAALHARLAGSHRLSDDEPGGSDNERALQALASLGENDRELLMLIAWDGLEAADVAQVLGVRRGTVAVRLHRARQRFADALAAQDAQVSTQLEVRR